MCDAKGFIAPSGMVSCDLAVCAIRIKILKDDDINSALEENGGIKSYLLCVLLSGDSIFDRVA